MSKPTLKIIFIGLDNSGKTSILYTLEGKFTQIASVKATVRFTRTSFTILGLPIKIWDMGGQKHYRNEYMNKQEFFMGTDLLFYVIDIQDPSRFAESLEYFMDILTIYEDIHELPKIMILLHKSDPDIRDSPEIQKNVRTIKKLFSAWPDAIETAFHETTIYNYVELSRVFVKGALKILPKGDVIQEVLNNFRTTTNSDAIMLLDENVLPIAEVYSVEESFNILKICGPFFASMVERVRKFNYKPPETIQLAMPEGWLFIRYLKFAESIYYLIFFAKAHENFKQINNLLPAFSRDLENVIKYVL